MEHLCGPAAVARAEALMDQGYSIHFHCWTREGFQSFLDRCEGLLPLAVRAVRSWRNENVFILERPAAERKDGAGDAHH